jgi:hypothetical protein
VVKIRLLDGGEGAHARRVGEGISSAINQITKGDIRGWSSTAATGRIRMNNAVILLNETVIFRKSFIKPIELLEDGMHCDAAVDPTAPITLPTACIFAAAMDASCRTFTASMLPP